MGPGRGRAFLVAVLICIAGPIASADAADKLRLADAATDACLISCESENASCKRICPTTFGAPCLNSCDTRAHQAMVSDGLASLTIRIACTLRRKTDEAQSQLQFLKMFENGVRPSDSQRLPASE